MSHMSALSGDEGESLRPRFKRACGVDAGPLSAVRNSIIPSSGSRPSSSPIHRFSEASGSKKPMVVDSPLGPIFAPAWEIHARQNLIDDHSSPAFFDNFVTPATREHMSGWSRAEGRNYVKERCVEAMAGISGVLSAIEEDEGALIEHQILKEQMESIANVIALVVPREDDVFNMVRQFISLFETS